MFYPVSYYNGTYFSFVVRCFSFVPFHLRLCKSATSRYSLALVMVNLMVGLPEQLKTSADGDRSGRDCVRLACRTVGVRDEITQGRSGARSGSAGETQASKPAGKVGDRLTQYAFAFDLVPNFSRFYPPKR